MIWRSSAGAQLAFAEDDEVRVGDVAQHLRHRLDQKLLPLVRHQRADVDEHRHAVRQPELGVDVDGRQPADLGDIDAVVHDDDLIGRDAVVHEDVADGVRRGDEEIDLPVLPPRERVLLQVKVDAPRRHESRPRRRAR